MFHRIVCFILFLSTQAQAQDNSRVLDSLRQVMSSSEDDSIRFEAMISFSDDTPSDSLALKAVLDALSLAESLSNEYMLAEAEYSLGFVYNLRLNQLDSSAKYYLNAVKGYQSLNDPKGEFKARYGYARTLDDQGLMKDAIDELLIALDLAELHQDTAAMTKANNVIANINNYLGYHDIALKYYNRSSDLARAVQDKLSEAIVLYNKAIILGEETQFDEQLSTLQRALLLTSQLEDYEFFASVMNSVGGAYQDLDQMDSAKFYLSEAEQILDSLVSADVPEARRGQAFNYQSLGFYYEKQEMPGTAISYFTKALSIGEELKNFQLIMNNSDYLSRVYESQGRYKEALSYYRKSTDLNDSIFTEENTLKLNEVQAKYENAKQSAENERLKSAANEQATVIQKQQLYNIFFGVISLIVFVSGGVLLLAYRKILRQKKAAEDDRTIIKKQSIQLEHNARLKSQFFSNIAHELRTPLTILLGMVDSLVKKSPQQFEESDFNKLKLAKSNGVKIQNLIDEIFELTKSEAHKLKLNAKPTEILPLMERLVFSFHSLAEDKSIDLNISYNQVHGTYVNLDPPKFEKIINNLIINALKFTEEEGNVTVKLGLKDDGATIVIKVEDTGVGIPADELEFVFDRFYQVSTSDNAAKPGTGLGLAMAKELTQLHEGQISVQSELGNGTTFSVELPIVEALPDLLETAEGEATDKQNEQLLDSIIHDIKKIDNGRVLIVEDNHDMRKYLVSIFEEFFNVATARNGKEALRSLETQKVNLIISDLMMPEMNGSELLIELKKDNRYRHIPVIMLTAKLDEHQKLDALKLGVDDYLTKPFNADEVLARANNLIRNQIQRSEYIDQNQSSETISIDDNLIKRITVHVKKHIGNYNITVSEIAHEMAMSERQLYRKVNELTGLTPNQLIREVKLREAMDKLNARSVSKVSVLAKEVGFESSAYFSKLFYQRFGKRPQEII